MWIELPDELIEFTKNIKNPLDTSMISINTLFDSMLKSQHIVYASNNVLQHFEKHELVNQSNKKFINWIRQKYIFIYECFDIINYKVIVSTTANVIERKENCFFVPLNCFYETRETKLLAEHESDADLFKNIFQQMYTFKKMSKNFSIRFENDAFHGGNAPSKIKKAAEHEQMMVCLIDSDKDYRGDKSGSTYKGASKIYNKVKKNHMIAMKQLNVREKENLIPPSLYLSILNERNVLLEIMQEFIEDENIIRFFDIKDGVKYEKINNENWIKNYKKVIDYCKEREIYCEPSNEEVDKDNYLCINGIGPNLCNVVNEILLEFSANCDKNMKHHSIRKDKKDEIYEYRKQIFDYLPGYLLDEWNQIYELLFEWGCCLSKNILPNYSFE